jgi:hypothetical protein
MTDETNAPAETQAGGEAPVDEPKKIDPEAKAEEPKAEVTDEDKGEDEGDQPKKKKPSGSERAKRREEYLLNELRERERRLEELERQSPKGDGGKAKDEPPKEEEFNGDWTAYVAARAAYEAGKAVEGKLNARERNELAQRQADAKRDRTLAHLDRVEEAKDTIADWDQVIGSAKGVTVHEDVIDLIIESDKSALLSYHLAKNPNKIRELNSMSGRELAREIGRLEGSLRMPAGKKQTTAPPPPANLKGGAAPHTDLAQVDDMNEFADRLLKDLAKRSGR